MKAKPVDSTLVNNSGEKFEGGRFRNIQNRINQLETSEKSAKYNVLHGRFPVFFIWCTSLLLCKMQWEPGKFLAHLKEEKREALHITNLIHLVNSLS